MSRTCTSADVRGSTVGAGVRTVDLRSLMRRQISSVSVLAAMSADGTPAGLTCSSLAGVSMDPPTVVVNIRRPSRSLEVIRAAGGFAVSLLADSGRHCAEAFAGGHRRPFESIDWEPSPVLGFPCMPQQSVGVLECRLEHTFGVADHDILIGAVVGTAVGGRPSPLLYGDRRYLVRDKVCRPDDVAADAAGVGPTSPGGTSR